MGDLLWELVQYLACQVYNHEAMMLFRLEFGEFANAFEALYDQSHLQWCCVRNSCPETVVAACSSCPETVGAGVSTPSNSEPPRGPLAGHILRTGREWSSPVSLWGPSWSTASTCTPLPALGEITPHLRPQ